MEDRDLKIDVPEIPLEDYEVPEDKLETALDLQNSYEGSVDYGVIGSGQCGSRLIKSFHSIGYNKAIAVNTASADLDPIDIPDEQKLLIGDGKGSGKSMLKGERAAEEAAQKIFDLMRDVFGSVDKIIICAGFGGGTGAGSLSVLIEIAAKYLKFLRKEGVYKDIIVFSALPTAGEAKSSLIGSNVSAVTDAISARVDEGKVGPVILIDNSKIEKLYRGVSPKKFWPTINDTVTGLFQTFNLLSSKPSGYTSFDAQDYQTVLSTSGLSVLGVAKVPSKDYETVKLSQFFQENFKKTVLLGDVDFSTAKEAACVVLADDKILSKISMDSINYGMDALSNLVGNATVHRGLYASKKSGIRVYTLISGMKLKSKPVL